jgi:hypothetical protein
LLRFEPGLLRREEGLLHGCYEARLLRKGHGLLQGKQGLLQ